VIHLAGRSDGGRHDGAMLFQALRTAMYRAMRWQLLRGRVSSRHGRRQ
jgi:hypothetical protein